MPAVTPFGNERSIWLWIGLHDLTKLAAKPVQVNLVGFRKLAGTLVTIKVLQNAAVRTAYAQGSDEWDVTVPTKI